MHLIGWMGSSAIFANSALFSHPLGNRPEAKPVDDTPFDFLR